MVEINYKFNYDSIVRIIKITNSTKANHLRKYIGSIGEIISRQAINEKFIKYKVRVGSETHYFIEEELIEVGKLD